MWEKARAPIALKSAVAYFVRYKAEGYDWTKFEYVGVFAPIDRKLGTEDYIAICRSEIGGKKPFNYPYFLIENDRQLVLAKMLLSNNNPNFSAWNFKKARKINR